ncbi:putative zinc finger motif, C2HC5-type [Carpediemonas membranifera]|uniref:Putative zinc finger motif, C2HC5-type n=1 Tax=Carpediemonas membranifera TaxID=201153 RepID=A0A8J6AP71_9EUKA|nr:putative zinc finger motif, C2HC5-type [Carpediemonas membranifera]|eukprot:KAG9389566.1 putative zinc finger motif, C2HC5-type [Carpediemonas membranifera]
MGSKRKKFKKTQIEGTFDYDHTTKMSIAEVQAMSVETHGKHYCNCNGTKHDLVHIGNTEEIAMCCNCGLVCCTGQTNNGWVSGPCLFCSAPMPGPGEPPALVKDQSYRTSTKSRGAAIEFREELLSRVGRRTRVIDDEAEWYEEQ